jgi:hypothetical protein
VCDSPLLERFFVAPGLPALCNALWPTAGEAEAAATGDVALAVCTDCGMITNTTFDPGVFGYSPRYENSLHFSAVFQRYATGVAQRLVDRYDLKRVDILEIGPGSGDFLAMLCDLGENRGIGYDPSHDPSRAPAFHADVRIRAEEFPIDGSTSGRLVCARHVLEHVPDPRSLLVAVRRSLDGPEAIAYVEVPDGGYLVEHVALWDVIYEHCHHFTAPALRRLMGAVGLEVIELGTSFGDQFLWVDSSRREPADRPIDRAAVDAIVAAAHAFGRRSQRLLDTAAGIVADRSEAGPVVLWGAGSKGVTFLNMVEGAERIEHAVDINPHKRGLRVPGSGHPVVAPSDLVEIRPSTAVVLNPLYVDEVSRQLAELGLTTEVVTLPVG